MWITHKNDILGGWVLARGDSYYDFTDPEFRALKTGDKVRVTTLLRQKLGRSPTERDIAEIRDAAGGRPFSATRTRTPR